MALPLPVSPVLLIGCALVCVAEILNIIGVASTHWIENSRGYHMGLFQTCSPECGDIEDPSADLKSVRAMLILGLLSGVAAIALSFVIFVNKLTFKPIPSMMFAISLAASMAVFIATIIGVGIYAGDIFYDLKKEYGALIKMNLGYSFALPVVGSILMALSGIMVFVGGKQPLGGEYRSLLGNR